MSLTNLFVTVQITSVELRTLVRACLYVRGSHIFHRNTMSIYYNIIHMEYLILQIFNCYFVNYNLVYLSN